jgi:hypothetical protein
MFWVKNPTQPAYWFDKPLSYSQHARKRCEQRSIPEQDFLPLLSKLVDCTRDMKRNPVDSSFECRFKFDEVIDIHRQIW